MLRVNGDALELDGSESGVHAENLRRHGLEPALAVGQVGTGQATGGTGAGRVAIGASRAHEATIGTEEGNIGIAGNEGDDMLIGMHTLRRLFGTVGHVSEIRSGVGGTLHGTTI